jgi:hypothetical protein
VPPRRNRGPIELRPNFHDGFIDGLLVNGLDARVFLRTASQEKFTIVLSGVKSLVLDDFRQGNIILSVDWLDPASLHDESVRRLYQVAQKSSVEERWILDAQTEGLHALEIIPSYGGALAAIFQGREIQVNHVLPS